MLRIKTTRGLDALKIVTICHPALDAGSFN